jgi:CRP-like cAMP-binding protein
MNDMIKQGEVFGGITVLMNAGLSIRTVIVEDNCLLYDIPKEIFLNICTRFVSFYENFLETFGRNLLDESLDLFIKNQVKKWAAKSEARIPIITIATEPGSGGSIIAQKIAERLAIDLFKDEIIQDPMKRQNGASSIERRSAGLLSGIPLMRISPIP